MAAWLFYALAVPFLFAVGNVLDKILRGRHYSTAALSVVTGIGGLSALLLLPFVGFSLLPLNYMLLAFLGGALFFFAAFPYLNSLSIEEASRVVPLWGLQSPIALIMALVFLGEELNALQFVAFWLVVIGAFLVSIRKLKDFTVPSRALPMMLLASSMTASAFVVNSFLYGRFAFWDVAIASFFGMGLGMIVVFLINSGYRRVVINALRQKAGRALLLVRIGIGIAASLMVGISLMTGLASLTVALQGLSSLFVLIFAVALSNWFPRLLKEDVSIGVVAGKAFAIALILAGVSIIALK